LDAVIFDDVKKKKTSPTIIEILEDIMNNAGYAFIIATPDDLGCLCKTIDDHKFTLLDKKITRKDFTDILGKFQSRARQNVVFEFGLFMGALGRDKVCCLLDVSVNDKPTDIDGILYEPFKESVRETFPQITEKLKDPKVGLIKP
jgi:predicted nucleotide-binding protein